MPVLSLACHLPHNTPHIPSRYNNEQTTKQTKAINNSYIYINISCKCDTNRAGHFTLDAYASRPVACAMFYDYLATFRMCVYLPSHISTHKYFTYPFFVVWLNWPGICAITFFMFFNPDLSARNCNNLIQWRPLHNIDYQQVVNYPIPQKEYIGKYKQLIVIVRAYALMRSTSM